MFTTFDKAIAAIIGGFASALVLYGIIPEGTASAETIGLVSNFSAAALVWLIPNKRHSGGGGP